jgi:COP9 signalosome complex subunit 4
LSLRQTVSRCCKLAPSMHSDEQAERRSRSAVITGILAPSGPNRTRVLAALNKDERVQSQLPPFMSVMLTKTFNDYIIRPAELEEFEACLEQHQRATGSSGETILQRAIRDHNVGACGKVSLLSCVGNMADGKVYDNIGFEALGALLNLDAEAAEATACK